MGSAETQGDLWGARAVEWADLQESSFRPLYEAAFAAVKLGKGASLLDAGCGAGLACSIAQSQGAQVSGIDAAAALVAIAKQRCPAADIRVGEIEALPFADNSFDVTTGFNAFQYASDAVHALAEARRVTKQNGSVVIAVWGERTNASSHLVSRQSASCFRRLHREHRVHSPCRRPVRWKLSPKKADLKPEGAVARVITTMRFPTKPLPCAACSRRASRNGPCAIREKTLRARPSPTRSGTRVTTTAATPCATSSAFSSRVRRRRRPKMLLARKHRRGRQQDGYGHHSSQRQRLRRVEAGL